MSVIWHDLECGGYAEDLELWSALAADRGDPILDIGAGSGRVTLELARRGYAVTALDHDPLLLAALRARASGLDVTAVEADAREFALGRRFPLCIVPMQTIQLLGGVAGRARFLRCALAHLEPGGLLAIAIAEELELYEVLEGTPAPLPDMREIAGVIYSSQPTAVRRDGEGFLLERRRETITTAGERTVADDVIRLDRLSSRELEREAIAVGLRPAGREEIAETGDYVGSSVVMLRA